MGVLYSFYSADVISTYCTERKKFQYAVSWLPLNSVN